jgi:hypothetical protein
MDVTESISFERSEWEAELREKALREGRRGGGSDFFIFPKELYDDILPFALGKGYWDCWIIWKARKLGAKVYDATDVCLPIHQNHDYGFLQKGQIFSDHPEVKTNYRLVGGWRYFFQKSTPTHKVNLAGISEVPRHNYWIHVLWRSYAYTLGWTYHWRRTIGLYRRDGVAES